MKEVQPIRSKRKLAAVSRYLKNQDEKYYIMFLLGCHTGLRVSDILSLRAGNVYGSDHVTISEKKTGKQKRFLINKKLQAELKKYIDSHDLMDEEYLIKSRKGDNKPISRVQAYRVLNDAAQACGIDEIGTHSMRKTFGYHYYKATHDVATLQKLFNHSSQRITLRYIGIESEQIDESLKDFYLF